MGELTKGKRLTPEPVSKISGRPHTGSDCEGDPGWMNEDQSHAAIPAGHSNAPGCRLSIVANPGGKETVASTKLTCLHHRRGRQMGTVHKPAA